MQTYAQFATAELSKPANQQHHYPGKRQTNRPPPSRPLPVDWHPPTHQRIPKTNTQHTKTRRGQGLIIIVMLLPAIGRFIPKKCPSDDMMMLTMMNRHPLLLVLPACLLYPSLHITNNSSFLYHAGCCPTKLLTCFRALPLSLSLASVIALYSVVPNLLCSEIKRNTIHPCSSSSSLFSP